jgi:RNA polymerase sigma factor (TIGR02999 family)
VVAVHRGGGEQFVIDGSFHFTQVRPMAGVERDLPDPLYSEVYGELKRLAHRQLRARSSQDTLCTTELVHEAFLKLGRTPDSNWESRAHFFGAASHAMREVLVDFARRKRASKRGGGWRAVSLSQAETALEIQVEDLLALDSALDQLDAVDQRLRQVVELRFFGGMPQEDIARMLGVSSRTVERDWLKARLFLLRAMNPVNM